MSCITSLQKQTLKSLECLRINSDEKILRDIDNFDNFKNSALVERIQGPAFDEDASGETAYYIIRSADGEIFAYFSIKCGLLFDKHGDLEIIDSKKKLGVLLQKRKLLSDNQDLRKNIKESLDNEIALIKDSLKRWIQIDENDAVHKRVAKTYSGIEICHFCVNDNSREAWNKLGFSDRNRQGVTLFWNNIVPKILELSEEVGIQFLYLFAADDTPERILVNYYKSCMNFEQKDDVFAALPVYDFGCTLLLQNISKLEEGKKAFFNDFNPEADAI